MKYFSNIILDEADQIVAASKSLDYRRVVAHDGNEINKLKAVLKDLRIVNNQAGESIDGYAKKQPVIMAKESADLDSLGITDLVSGISADEVVSKEVVTREDIMESLAAEGLAGRAGLIYSSFSSNRTQPLSQAHHHRGIPPYSVVVAPDFTPVPGFHGVFISTKEVISAVLPADSPTADWQVLKRRSYKGMDDMVEILSLISAGFDLP